MTVASAAGQARGGSWSQDGTIVFSPGNNSELWRVAAAGGKPVRITSLDTAQENSHRWPHFLPDGRHFLYTSGRNGVYVTSLDAQTPQRLLTGATNAMHDSAGYLLFVRDGALVAQRFDADRLELSGEAFTVVDRMASPRALRLARSPFPRQACSSTPKVVAQQLSLNGSIDAVARLAPWVNQRNTCILASRPMKRGSPWPD